MDLLAQWERHSEGAALLAIEKPAAEEEAFILDSDMIRFYGQCFDRPAFQDEFHQEGSMEAFDEAIEDTITAINTGCLRSRDGARLSQSSGKAFLRSSDWRQRMDEVVDLLRAIRSRYEGARRLGIILVGKRQDGREWYCIYDRSIAERLSGYLKLP